ncbi:hypothetical protein FB451DRAFT_792983 [Mycena latifolia]|nr:hypothetical protein FB451DRAFT_792983 [Mycena latifolia]
MSSELPPEVWLQILRHLPRIALSVLSSVSPLFHALSVPLIFVQFQYHPSVYTEILQRGTRLQRELDRLAFWSSDEIAPHVRRCFVAIHWAPVKLDAPNTLVDALFAAVSRFTNLRLLSCKFGLHPVELLPLRVEGIALLDTLKIHGPRLARYDDESTRRKLRVKHFSYTDIPVPHPSPTRVSPFVLLDPAALCSLELAAGRPGGLEHFLADRRAMAACHNLHTLRLAFVDTDFARIHACIAPFPAVRVLIVELKGACRTDVDLRTTLAPQLERYHGPAALLPLVLPGATPAHVGLSRGSAGDVLGALRSARRPDWITSLSLGVALLADVLQGTTLREIFTHCPHLVHLTLAVSMDGRHCYPDAEEFCAQLVDILKGLNALETSVFRWRLEKRIVPDRAQLEALLRSAHLYSPPNPSS